MINEQTKTVSRARKITTSKRQTTTPPPRTRKLMNKDAT
jgi:hypothetical protein